MFLTSLRSIRMTWRRSFWPDFMAAFMSSVSFVRTLIFALRISYWYYRGILTEGCFPSIAAMPPFRGVDCSLCADSLKNPGARDRRWACFGPAARLSPAHARVRRGLEAGPSPANWFNHTGGKNAYAASHTGRDSP